jgi:hypothetical protein
MDKIIETVEAVIADFEKKNGRMPNSWEEFDAIEEQAKMLDSLGPVDDAEFDDEETEWNEA